MFLNLKEILTPAYNQKFAVLACNIRHPIIMAACLDAAFAVQSPIILEIAESEQEYCAWSPEEIVPQVQLILEQYQKLYGYTVPVGLHLDHVQKDEALIERALQAGFRSALLDLSRFNDEENYRRCLLMKEKMRSYQASLEMEQGAIGFAKDLPAEDVTVESLYTTVEKAVLAVETVQPDALAIAVGNGHGLYKETPHIGFARIQMIADALHQYRTPLVLHGGSGLSLDIFAQAVAVGINKVNYATELSLILFSHLPQDLQIAMEEAAKIAGTEWRKMIGRYKSEIAAVEQNSLRICHQDLKEHVIALLTKGLGSAYQAKLYQ
ncbi:MAG: class II fructose-bisphosphate aldolase [Candidatus Abawacabacteria bacterium]|nr:class II fructose-bisphosphate aldolase [Candidatus Abawacabacteria bacterium]